MRKIIIGIALPFYLFSFFVNAFTQGDYYERVVLIKAKTNVLTIANNIRKVNFDFSKISPVAPP